MGVVPRPVEGSPVCVDGGAVKGAAVTEGVWGSGMVATMGPCLTASASDVEYGDNGVVVYGGGTGVADAEMNELGDVRAPGTIDIRAALRCCTRFSSRTA